MTSSVEGRTLVVTPDRVALRRQASAAHRRRLTPIGAIATAESTRRSDCGNPAVMCREGKRDLPELADPPSGHFHAGINRHIRPTRDGNLLIHQSSTNRIILVTLNGREKTQ
jgi:hypothetical protein